jgi:hypothetical protein
VEKVSKGQSSSLCIPDDRYDSNITLAAYGESGYYKDGTDLSNSCFSQSMFLFFLILSFTATEPSSIKCFCPYALPILVINFFGISIKWSVSIK